MSIVRRAPRNTNYTVVTNDIIDNAEMTAEGMAILIVLLSKPDNWQVNRKHLSKVKKACGETKIRRVLKELEDLGYLRRTQTRREDGTFDHESIVGDVPFWWEQGETAGQTSGGFTTSGGTTCGSTTGGEPPSLVSTDVATTDVPITEEERLPGLESFGSSEQKTEDPKGYTDVFEEMWSVYPRRTSKKAAFKAWTARVNQGHKTEEMKRAAENYAKQIRQERTEQRYVKLGSTFFGPDEHFLDYTEEVPNLGGRTHNVMEDRGGESGEVSVADELGLSYTWEEEDE